MTAFNKHHLLQWASAFETCVLLDNHNAQNAFGLHDIELACAAGARHMLVCDVHGAFDALKSFYDAHQGEWIFGFLTYDLKNDVERLHSGHPDHIGFPALCFFVPEHLIIVGKDGSLRQGAELLENLAQQPHPQWPAFQGIGNLQAKVSRDEYIKVVEQLREHIAAGDIYEINYCVEFFARQHSLNPEQLYDALTEISPVPFGAYVKYQNRYLLCASPERFVRRLGQRLYSQPIKGTSARHADAKADAQSKEALLQSEKERAENLMIVDLVRNDLARSAETGSVKVDELFGMYSFPQVHQMISTVSSTLRSDVHPVDAIRYAFPMGSMTGAPKIMAMELIERYECTRRGLYSGSVGYFAPNGDFDFNVVIRSLQYNAASGYLNFEVGGAITYDSVPEQEYEECLLKAKAMMRVLGQAK